MQMNPPDWMTDADRAAYSLLLEIWREFMGGGDHSLGFHSRDPILQSEGSLDSEQLYSRADYAMYQAVDGCIDSLMPLERAAIYATNGQARVIRPTRYTFAEVLDMAERHLLPKLKSNASTAIKF